MITFTTNSPPLEMKRSRRRRLDSDALLRLCEKVIEFMAEHHLEGCKAYLALGNGTPELYLLTQNEVFDFELSDKLSTFAGPYIARRLLGNVALLPASSPDELTAYLDVNKAIRIERTH